MPQKDLDKPSGYRLVSLISRLREATVPLKHFHKASWIIPAVRYAKALYDSWPYDIVVSTFDPAACHIIASILKRTQDVFWVADYRDLLTGNPFQTASPFYRSFEKKLERFFLAPAGLVTTVSDPLRERLTGLLGKPTLTIENGFDPEDAQGGGKRIFPEDGEIRLLYTGKIYPHRRDPSPLFAAVRALKNSGELDPKRLRIYFFCPKSDHLEEMIRHYEIVPFVQTADIIDRASSLQIQKEADALLFLDWNDPSSEGILSAKIFEYLFSGTPILSIGTDFATSSNTLIKESGTGVILGRSVEGIAEILRKLISGGRVPYAPSSAVIERYHRRELAMKLLDQIIARRFAC